MTAATLLLHCAETPVGVSFPAGLSLLFFFFLLPVCLSQFPSRYPMFLCFSVSVVSLSTQSVSLSQFPPFSAVFLLFSSFFLFCVRVVFIEVGGVGLILPHPIAAHAWGARRLLCHDADSGGQWRRRLWDTAALASHHEMGCV